MRFEERIEQMIANGKLTTAQAETLRSSLRSGVAAGEKSHLHPPLPLGAIALGLVIALLAALIFFSGGSEQPAAQTIQNVSETLNQTGKVGEMNKSLTTIISLLLIGLPVIGSLLWFTFSYNGLVSKEEDVLSSWAQVESNYQRRADLIPNLVSTVKNFAEHEGQTLTEIARLRAQTENVEKESAAAREMAGGSAARLGDEAYMEQLAQAEQNVSRQLKGLMVSIESYPALKSSDQYLELQAQLEGTENRINVARMAFNETVNSFNSAIRRLPGSLVAGVGGFQRKAYFKADEGADKVIPVDFSNTPAVAPVE